MSFNAAPAPRPSRAAQLSALIVDDSRAMRRIVIRKLAEAGLAEARVIEAADGAEALAIARRERPSLILADWNMPAMNGLELLHALQTEGMVCFFGLITSDVEHVRAQALEAGARFVMQKPVTADALRAALAPLIESDGAQVPSSDRLAEVLGGALHRTCTVAPRQVAVFAGAGQILVAVYERQGDPAALVVCDAELSGLVASALSPEPSGGSAPQAEPASLRALFERCTALFPGAELKGVHTQLRTLPPRVVPLFVRPARQGVFTVSLPELGSGGLFVNVAG